MKLVCVYPHPNLPLFPSALKKVFGDEYVQIPGYGSAKMSEVDGVDLVTRRLKVRATVASRISMRVQMMIRSSRLEKDTARIRVKIPDNVQPGDLRMSDRALLFFQSAGFFDEGGQWRNRSLLEISRTPSIGARYLMAYLIAADDARDHQRRGDNQEPAGLEEELASMVNNTLYSPRANQFFMEANGWGGHGVKTFEDVGRLHGLTRERVRQLVSSVEVAVSQSYGRVQLKHLHKAIAAISRAMPCSAAEAARMLREKGISKIDFHPSGVRAAADLLGLYCNWELFDYGGQSVVASAAEHQNMDAIMKEARSLCSSTGIASIAMVAHDERLQALNVSEKLVALTLRASSEVMWMDCGERCRLDGGPSWFWFPHRRQRNTTLLKISKLVSYAGSVNLADIRSALSRYGKKGAGTKHFEGLDAPEGVLSEFCRQAGFSVRGEKVMVTKDCAVEIPAVELKMANALKDAGGAMKRAAFNKLCESIGIPGPTFAIYVMTSPLFVIDAKKVVYLRGITFSSAASKSTKSTRSIKG